MKGATYILLVILTCFGSCGPAIYQSSNFDKKQRKIKIIAKLPFSVNIDMHHLPKGITPENIRNAEEKTGYDLQSSSYTWFLKRQDKYTTVFQDIDKTNAILRKEKISYSDIALQDKSKICKLLGVDAVISGRSSMSKPMTEIAAVAVGLISGAWGPTNSISNVLTIHDMKAKLLWKYDHNASGSVLTSPDSLIKSLMKNASRKFPFKK